MEIMQSTKKKQEVAKNGPIAIEKNNTSRLLGSETKNMQCWQTANLYGQKITSDYYFVRRLDRRLQFGHKN